MRIPRSGGTARSSSRRLTGKEGARGCEEKRVDGEKGGKYGAEEGERERDRDRET
jgi:hypothetical protein